MGGRAIELAAVAFSFLLHTAAFSQVPRSASDTLAADSARTDSIPRDTTPRVVNPHGMQVALYALVFAPGAIPALIPKDSSRSGSSLGFADNHLAFYVTGGLASGRDGPVLGASWTGSGRIQVFLRSALLEVRVEQFQLLEHVEYRTVRAGRLFRPNKHAIGGLTLGYRSVRNLAAHEGVEIAFPLIAGDAHTWVRVESGYVVSDKQSSWNYLLQLERRVGRGPLLIGCNVELKTLEIRNHGKLSHGNFALVLALTPWQGGSR